MTRAMRTINISRAAWLRLRHLARAAAKEGGYRQPFTRETFLEHLIADQNGWGLVDACFEGSPAQKRLRREAPATIRRLFPAA